VYSDWFDRPRAADEENKERAMVSNRGLAQARILVIQNSPEIQQFLANQVLEPYGYEHLVSTDGEKGIQQALDEQPDLILLDVQMDGLRMIEVLHEQGVNAPIIVMGMDGSVDPVVQSFRLGAHDFLTKPLDPLETREAIRRALSSVAPGDAHDPVARKLLRANQQLKNILQRVETILQAVQTAIVVVDEGNSILMSNVAAHAALGLTKDARGRPVGESISHTAVRSMFAEVRRTGRAIRSEVSLEDGRMCNVHLAPVPGVGQVLMMQDITHLKELDRIKSEYVTTVSHDLRTPLTTVQGYVELLPRAGPMNEQQQGFILRVREGIETITNLLDKLLDVERLEAGLDMEMAPCDLNQVIDEAVRDVRPKTENKHQELDWEPSESMLLVSGNAYRLRQVMDNLLGNAITYTGEGGRIALSTTVDGGHVVVNVTDDGIGIPVEQQSLIFDKFYRVESDDNLDIAGAGLGLAIVKTVIEAHSGRVWVESNPGTGSTFSFVLPVLDT
jgi:signal transduction histidine kinase